MYLNFCSKTVEGTNSFSYRTSISFPPKPDVSTSRCQRTPPGVTFVHVRVSAPAQKSKIITQLRRGKQMEKQLEKQDKTVLTFIRGFQ